MNAEKYGLDRIYFGGCFIRGEKWRRRASALALLMLPSVQRSRCDDLHAVLCHSILEPRDRARHVSSARGFPVGDVSLPRRPI